MPWFENEAVILLTFNNGLFFFAWVFYPCFSFTIFPNSKLHITINIDEFPFSFLSSFYPISLNYFTTVKYTHSWTMFLVIEVCTFKDSTVLIIEFTLAVHLVIGPLPYVSPSISPCVLTLSFKCVVVPLTSITRIIWPHIITITLFETIFKFSYIFSAVTKKLGTFSMGHIIN